MTGESSGSSSGSRARRRRARPAGDAVGRVGGEERPLGRVDERRGRRHRLGAALQPRHVAVLVEDRQAGLGGLLDRRVGRPRRRRGLRLGLRLRLRLGLGLRGADQGLQGRLVVLGHGELGHRRQDHDAAARHRRDVAEQRLRDAGGVADVLLEVGGDAAGGVDVAEVDRARQRVGVQDGVAQQVERLRHPGAHPPRPQHLAVLARRGRHGGLRQAGPAPGEQAVEQAGEVADVAGGPAAGLAVQGGVDAVADQPDPAGAVDEHVLRRQPAVRDARGVGRGDRVGHLGHHPGRAPRPEVVFATTMSKEEPQAHSLTT